jgi:hypothetical protein
MSWESGADIVVSRPHEGIISEVAADVSLDNLSADSIARNKVFVLTFRAYIISMAASHYEPRKAAKLRSKSGEVAKEIRGRKLENPGSTADEFLSSRLKQQYR